MISASFRKLSSVILACILVIASAQPAMAHSGDNGAGFGPTWVGYYDQMYMWDNHSGAAIWWDVDWPVHLFFWDFADINYVKNAGPWWLTAYTSPKYLSLDDGWGWNYDSDDGKKSDFCAPWNQDHYDGHYRVYSAGQESGDWDAMWDPYWGYYVVMTTHYDYNDPNFWWDSCYGMHHGYDEAAESDLAWWYSQVANMGYQYAWMGNSADHADYYDGAYHFRDSDGYMSFMQVY